MPPLTIGRIWQGLLDTFTMVSISALIVVLVGIPLTLILVSITPGNALKLPHVCHMLGALINDLRATPFIILLVTLLSLTRLMVGTAIGVWTAVIPLSISATPFFARAVEISLHEVDRGLMEAAQTMGCECRHIVWRVLLPGTLSDIISGFTLTVVSLTDVLAMAGAVDTDGLGDIAIRYGYQRFDTTTMAMVIVVLIGLMSLVQWVGDVPVRRLKAR